MIILDGYDLSAGRMEYQQPAPPPFYLPLTKVRKKRQKTISSLRALNNILLNIYAKLNVAN